MRKEGNGKRKAGRMGKGWTGLSLRAKLMWALGGIVAVSVLGFLGRDYSLSTEKMEKINKDLLRADYKHFLQLIRDTAGQSYSLASCVASIPQVQERLAAGDREGLKALTVPIYETLKKNLGVAQFQFHLPSGKSFLRLHDLDRFGDDLTSFRKTVVEVNRTKEPRIGVERGKAGLSIRGVVPVFHEGKHVGSVEFGRGLSDRLVAGLKEEFGFDVFVFVPGEGGFRLLASSDRENPPPADRAALEEVVSRGEPLTRREERDGKDLVTYYGPFKDFSGKAAGVVVIPVDFTKEFSELKMGGLLSLGVGSVIFLVILGMIHFLIGRFVSKPVGLMEEAFAFAGEGDLSQRVKVDTEDELGSLAKSFNTFMERIQESFKELVGNTKTLDSSAGGLTEIAEEMTKGVEETSERSRTVAAAAEEMSVSIHTVAGAAKQAAANVAEVTVRVKELEGSFREIRSGTEKAQAITERAVEAARSASAGVTQLGDAAKKIDVVTEVITDISEQTALLALNATIEASRAGEAGKGFAVVANEVKALAKQTAEATLEIKSSVESIQGSTAEAAERINRITSIVEEINGLVSTIALEVERQTETTEEIAQNISQASGGITEMSASVEEVSTVSQEIAKDIGEVNSVAEAMAGNSGDVRGNARRLRELSSTLKEMVERFQV